MKAGGNSYKTRDDSGNDPGHPPRSFPLFFLSVFPGKTLNPFFGRTGGSFDAVPLFCYSDPLPEPGTDNPRGH